MSRSRAAVSFFLSFAACGVAVIAAAADPAPPPPPDQSTQLKTYSVGGTKTTPKADSTTIAPVDKPKFDSGMKIERPVMVVDMAPFVVTPVIASPAPATVAPSAAGKTTAAVTTTAAAKPAAAPAKPNVGGTTATGAGALPAATTKAAPAPAPTGALPQAQTAAAPPATLALVPISTPSPDYPREAALAGTQGYVVVEFTINSDGGTQDINVIDASPQRTFDQAARRAVSRWKFQPLLEDGRPVEKRVQRRIEFKL